MNTCPDKCSGKNSTRQHKLTEEQFARLSNTAQKEIIDSGSMGNKCEYCGCVYTNGGEKLGVLDGNVTGEEWKSSKYP